MKRERRKRKTIPKSAKHHTHTRARRDEEDAFIIFARFFLSSLATARIKQKKKKKARALGRKKRTRIKKNTPHEYHKRLVPLLRSNTITSSGVGRQVGLWSNSGSGIGGLTQQQQCRPIFMDPHTHTHTSQTLTQTKSFFSLFLLLSRPRSGSNSRCEPL